jgi:hypothetical protein
MVPMARPNATMSTVACSGVTSAPPALLVAGERRHERHEDDEQKHHAHFQLGSSTTPRP